MEKILEWMKQFIIVYLILTVMVHLAPAEKYKKYLRFFSGLVLLLFLVMPVLRLSGDDGRLAELVSYEAFWEQLGDAGQGERKLQFLQHDHYIKKYEQAVRDDIISNANARDIPVKDVTVSLDEYYSIKSVSVTCGGSDTGAAGQVRKMLREEYRLKDSQISTDG